MFHRSARAAAAVFLAALAATGSIASRPAAGSAPSEAGTTPRFYVSLGDSYAAGMQAVSATERHPTVNGFAYQLVDLAPAQGYDFSLANFGCGGATTDDLLHRIGCDHDRLGPGATPYDSRTQATAAAQFLRAHRGQVGLITVVIGINDLLPCAGRDDITPCVNRRLDRIRTNLGALLGRLRSAAGPRPRIVGITYPDVFLARLLDDSPAAHRVATKFRRDFRLLINPQLRKSYRSAGDTFVNITRATGGYGSLGETTTVPPYGTIPVPVAKICRFTFECEFRDVHPTTKGYALIARRILATLPAG